MPGENLKINNLPAVASMQGVALFPHEDPKKSWVEAQYIGHNNEWHTLKIPLLDALYLANLLEGIISDNNLGHLRRPPGTAH